MCYKNWANDTMNRILNKLESTALQIGASFPHATKDGIYTFEGSQFWTNGFWPGILWMAYQNTKDEKFANIAKEIENKMDEVLDSFELLDHDMGFMWMLSAGANYMINGNKESRLRLLKASSHLAGRFNPKGQFIRAWEWEKGQMIIDCAMNLPLLYWATDELDDPRFAHIAHSHLETVLKYSIRPDSSVNHILEFDPQSGEFLHAVAGQGAAADSAWSRGTSWAVYGLALAYRHFKEEEILIKLKNVSNFFIANLAEDNVAHWDFRVERNSNTPRDTSATACAACGLLELSEYLPKAEADMYRKKAYLMLKSLTDNYSNLENNNMQSLLNGATGAYTYNENINVGLIYADYFYMEGISRLCGNKDIFWYGHI
ncbi:MAG: glycoside hydrolase family 88 protein [Clostridia bacterium]|nr:glycoside hydrolase family 88 protein [Clostridia bacterium]